MQIETTVTGGQLGRLLAQDPEELGYALEAMAEAMNGHLGSYASDLYLEHEPRVPEIIAFLRAFADALEAEHANR